MTFLCVFSQVPLVAVDSYFYGKAVVAPLNILLYNVFTSHGPDLYGNKHLIDVRSWFKNMFLFFFYFVSTGSLMEYVKT